MKGKLGKFLPLIILILGVLISFGIIRSKAVPERKGSQKQQVAIVRVETLKSQPYQIIIEAYGTSAPSQELAVAPRISGQVQSYAVNFIEGDYVVKDQLLFKLEPIDSMLQLEQAKANLAKAEYDLDNVMAQKKAAQLGYKGFLKSQTPEDQKNLKMSPLASFKPQLKNARAALASVKANLRMAKINLSRTSVYAPFSGYLRQVNIAVGQQLNTGQVVAQLFADRPIRLKVSLPLADLPWIQFHNTGQKGSNVILSKKIGPQVHKWKGEVTLQLQEIDSLGRMAQVMVEVADPISNLGFSLPLNLQLKINILGKTLDSVTLIPLHALRSQDEIWLVEDQKKLIVRSVNVLRKEKEVVLIQDGFKTGEQIVVSSLEAAISGMGVKIYTEEPTKVLQTKVENTKRKKIKKKKPEEEKQ